MRKEHSFFWAEISNIVSILQYHIWRHTISICPTLLILIPLTYPKCHQISPFYDYCYYFFSQQLVNSLWRETSMKISCSLSKFPPLDLASMIILSDPSFTMFVAQPWFSNSSPLSTFTSCHSAIYYKQNLFLLSYLFIMYYGLGISYTLLVYNPCLYFIIFD